MKFASKKIILSLSAIVMLVVLATAGQTFGQGRGNGHGKGGDKGGGGGQKQQIASPGGSRVQRGGGNGHQQKFERQGGNQNRAFEMQRGMQRAQQQQQRQQFEMQRQAQRQQMAQARQYQRHQYDQQRQIQRQQADQARQYQRQQYDQQRQIQRQQKQAQQYQRQQYEQQRRYQREQYQQPARQQRQWTEWQGGDRKRDKRERSREESFGRYQQQRQWNQNVIINRYPQAYSDYDRRRDGFEGYKNYGQFRSAQVHRRNALRKAERENRYGYYPYAPVYDQPYYRSYSNDYPGYFRDNFLRSVIASAFQNDLYEVPTYNTVTVYQTPYYGNYGYNGYNQTYPSYSYYPEYGAYAGDYRVSPLYVDGPYYADRRNMIGELIGSIAVPLLDDSPIGGFVSRIFSEMLANGYDEGYYAGQYARSQGYYDDQYYNDPYDPYVYDNVSFSNIDYNPYSCLAENRRYLSEGYELGYQDGLRDQANQFAVNNNGAVDLVSVLLGNVL